MTSTAAVEAVWRIESARLTASLARLTGDFAAAEDLAQDAFEIALVQWPRDGVPAHPGSWFIATAKHRAIDLIRRRASYHAKLRELGTPRNGRRWATRWLPWTRPGLADLRRPAAIGVHRLPPGQHADSQVALTLRAVAGLRTDEIARAFLVSEATMGQRISRAKQNLSPAYGSSCRPPRSSRSGWTRCWASST